MNGKFHEPVTSTSIIASWDKDEVAIILNALAAVDDQDLEYLLSRLGNGGRDQFWKSVIGSLRLVFIPTK